MKNAPNRHNLTIRDLSLSFGERAILKGVNLTVPLHSSFAILGESGSGKSVLLKSIIGLIEMTSGFITLGGDKNQVSGVQQKHHETMRHFGMLFQHSALFDGLSVWENISFALLKSKVFCHKEAKAHALTLLELVGLDSRIADSYPESLSGGMRKRVALARTIASKPSILLLDEPTTGLDPITAENIGLLIHKVTKQLNATTISVSHDMKYVWQTADFIGIIRNGQIPWVGTKQEFASTKDPYIQRFLQAGRSL